MDDFSKTGKIVQRRKGRGSPSGQHDLSSLPPLSGQDGWSRMYFSSFTLISPQQMRSGEAGRLRRLPDDQAGNELFMSWSAGLAAASETVTHDQLYHRV
ncbi:MAG: hypothetical protein ACLVG5_03050 [Clostridium sp.]